MTHNEFFQTEQVIQLMTELYAGLSASQKKLFYRDKPPKESDMELDNTSWDAFKKITGQDKEYLFNVIQNEYDGVYRYLDRSMNGEESYRTVLNYTVLYIIVKHFPDKLESFLVTVHPESYKDKPDFLEKGLKIYRAYYEATGRTFLSDDGKRFWIIAFIANGTFSMTEGKTGTLGQSTKMWYETDKAANKEIEKKIAAMLKKGYVEDINYKPSRQDITQQNNDDKEEILNEESYLKYAAAIKTDEANERYCISDSVDFPFADYAEEQQTCIVQSNIRVKSISINKQDWSPFNLIVDGDLTVDENIDWNEWGNGSFLFVTGNLCAKNLFMAGCPEIVVLGNLTVENGIVGSQGDNGGRLVVKGTTKAAVILCSTYFRMEFSARPEAKIIGDKNDFDFEIDLDTSDYSLVAETINPDCFPEEEGVISSDEFKNLLIENKNIFV